MSDAVTTTELWFLRVPLPESRYIVSRLRELPSVITATAVYGGFDVVAILTDTQERIDLEHQKIEEERESEDLPIDFTERVPVDKIMQGVSYGSCQPYLRSACTAFIRCARRRESVESATSVLVKLPGVARLFPSSNKEEVILEAVAVDKQALDDTVMSTIQGHRNAAKFTHTFIVIDDLQWHRNPTFPEPSLLIVSADVDLPLAMGLSARLTRDTGIACHTYPRLPGDAQLPLPLNDLVDEANCRILAISDAAMESVSCQRLFYEVSKRSIQNEACCVVLPSSAPERLASPYAGLPSFDASSLLAYPSLLDWIRDRLDGPGYGMSRPSSTS